MFSLFRKPLSCLAFSLFLFTQLFAATITVTTTADATEPPVGSLRAALENASAGDTIVFAAGIAGGTITAVIPFEPPSNVTIDGTTRNMTISGGSAINIFSVIDGDTATGSTIQNLTLANGHSNARGAKNEDPGTGNGGGGGGGGCGSGGAIFIPKDLDVTARKLTLNNITFSGTFEAVGANGGTGTYTGVTGSGGGGGGGRATLGSNQNSGTGGSSGGITASEGGIAGGEAGASGESPTEGFGDGGGGGGTNNGTTKAGNGGNGIYTGGGGGGGQAASGAAASGGDGGNGSFGAGSGGGGSRGSSGTSGTAGTPGVGGGAGGAAGTAGNGGGGGGAGLGAVLFLGGSGQANTLTVNSDVPAGTVTAGSGGAAGGNGVAGSDGQAAGTSIFLDGTTITFGSNNSSVIVSGSIADSRSLSVSGASGNIVKQGTGTLTLPATNTYNGTTTVSSGILAVNGSIAGSTTTVAVGATLKGTGTVGPLTVNGLLAPGNSIGTINVSGPYTQVSGSTLDIELSPIDSSRVSVTGLTTIQDNVTLNLIPQAGDYPKAPSYIIIDSAGGITGTFSSITVANSNLDGIPSFVEYTSTQALLHLGGGSPLIFLTSNLATRMNRMQMGLITEVQDQRFLRRQVCYEDPACCEKSDEDSENSGDQIEPSYEETRTSCSKEPAYYHPYLIFDYSKSDIEKRPNMFAGKDYLRGAIIGSDFYFSDIFTGGVALGYIHANSNPKATSGNLRANNFNLATYFQFHQSDFYQKDSNKNFYFDGAFTWAKVYYEEKSSTAGFTSAKFHGYEFSTQGRLLYQNEIKNLFYRPYLSSTYYLQKTDPYTERRDSPSRLKVHEASFDFLELELGMTLWAPFRVRCWRLVPQFSFAYVKGYLNDPYDVTVVFAQDINALLNTLKIANISTKQWKVSGSLSAFYSECREIFFTYEGIFDDAYSNYQEYRLGVQGSF